MRLPVGIIGSPRVDSVTESLCSSGREKEGLVLSFVSTRRYMGARSTGTAVVSAICRSLSSPMTRIGEHGKKKQLGYFGDEGKRQAREMEEDSDRGMREKYAEGGAEEKATSDVLGSREEKDREASVVYICVIKRESIYINQCFKLYNHYYHHTRLFSHSFRIRKDRRGKEMKFEKLIRAFKSRVCASAQQVHAGCTSVARSQPVRSWGGSKKGVEKDERSDGIKCIAKEGIQQAKRARDRHAPSATIHVRKTEEGERKTEREKERERERDRKG
ncbi:hypothetical protein G5I_06094 [Acromyrmex echinatior]|uniref:Uncharacterized protein n=1 Tax=Acromyrmex echinatior TaxID=103372 RepID=F4WK51_ACREC|nr:hypothetical protein G5I_06094 [Acromyrmex echinatior]